MNAHQRRIAQRRRLRELYQQKRDTGAELRRLAKELGIKDYAGPRVFDQVFLYFP